MGEIILYHGSNVIVTKPDIKAGKSTHDFGRAFYLTTDMKQAQKWSRHKFRLDQSTYDFKFLISRFSIDTNNLAGLNIKTFQKPNKEWLKYVISNRNNVDFANSADYDLIIGPVVDGKGSWNTLSRFINEQLSFAKTIQLIKPDNLTDQWAFKSQEAIRILKYRGVIYENK